MNRIAPGSVAVAVVAVAADGRHPYRNERPLGCLYDNLRMVMLSRSAQQVLWHPRVEKVARFYGFTPRACAVSRAD